MIKPMLAVPLSKGTIHSWEDWAIEEKYDGHRLIVQVDRNSVTAWTRPRKHAGDASGKSMSSKVLPTHLVEALGCLPAGVYDGELLGGDTSTDVTRTDLAHTLRFIVFDVLRQDDVDTTIIPYFGRRSILEKIFGRVSSRRGGRISSHVSLAESRLIRREADVTAFVDRVWQAGGEGAILKRKAATYQPGKRSRDFIKVKKCCSAVMTVIGFEATRGKIMNRGAFAMVRLRDDAGNETSVKTKDEAEIAMLEKEAVSAYAKRTGMHPSIGRQLRIEFQDFTPEGGYRHPRWDRWENE